MKAMLFAAGMGTRLKPFTDSHPKALALVNGKTLLQRNIEYLKSYNLTEIVINIHHFGQQILDFLKKNENFGCQILISDETNEVLETGGGLMKAKPFLMDEDFLVMNVDILTEMDLSKMIQYHFLHKPLVTLAVSDRESSRKLMFDKEMMLCGWKNISTGEEIITKSKAVRFSAFSGIHIISNNLFEKVEEKGKFSIMKTYMRLMSSECIKGFDHSGSVLIDVGKPEAIEKAEIFFK